jgi:pilus assembly protein Flp/PilA
MNDLLQKLSVRFQTLIFDERGQDLVEYALIVALIAFGATAGMGLVATEVNHAFDTISSKLASAL